MLSGRHRKTNCPLLIFEPGRNHCKASCLYTLPAMSLPPPPRVHLYLSSTSKIFQKLCFLADKRDIIQKIHCSGNNMYLLSLKWEDELRYYPWVCLKLSSLATNKIFQILCFLGDNRDTIQNIRFSGNNGYLLSLK